MIEIRQLGVLEGGRYLQELARILKDCVDGGASVGFREALSPAEAASFFEKVFEEVALGHRILLAAFLGSQMVGTVQLMLTMPPNQRHRADVAKLLVLRSARAQGIGRRLMEQVETVGRLAGKSLLVLDTVTGGSAERLYLRLGWTRAGVIPKYALFPNGDWCDTTIFWKQLM